MFTADQVSRVACRLSSSAFTLRSSRVSISGFVACVGFKSFAQARLLARFAAPRLPMACGGVRVRNKAGLWWVSVPVAEASVPEEVARGGALCSVGSPPDVRVAIKGSGWV